MTGFELYLLASNIILLALVIGLIAKIKKQNFFTWLLGGFLVSGASWYLLLEYLFSL